MTGAFLPIVNKILSPWPCRDFSGHKTCLFMATIGHVNTRCTRLGNTRFSWTSYTTRIPNGRSPGQKVKLYQKRLNFVCFLLFLFFPWCRVNIAFCPFFLMHRYCKNIDKIVDIYLIFRFRKMRIVNNFFEE